MRSTLPCLLTVLVLFGCAEARGPATPAGSEQHLLKVGEVPVRVRLARTAAERSHGLKGVTTLAGDEGMLFLYREPARRSIWMQGCHIGLDVAFADTRGRILEVVTLRPPTETPGAVDQVRSGADAVYVLEVPAGFFARHGLGVGTLLTLPAAADRSRADP